RKISFTGSTEVGKQLLRGCADQMKGVSLELGGHAPFIVFPDADPEVGAKIAVTGKFRNNGQVCIAPSRFYVHKDVEKNVTDLTVAWKMAEGVEAGIIGINDPVPATPQCPFGGMKESGMGRELAHEGLEAYLETKYISLKLRDG